MSKIMLWYVWMVTYLCRNVTIVHGASYHLLGSQISWDSKIRFWLQVEFYISDWQFSKSRHLASYVSCHNDMAYDNLWYRFCPGSCITCGPWVPPCSADQVLPQPLALVVDWVQVCPGRCRWKYAVALTLMSQTCLSDHFPEFRMEQMEFPLLKALAFALLRWIRKTIMSAVC